MLPAAEHRQQHLLRLPPLEADLFPREPRDPVTAFGEREVPSSVLPVPVRIVVEAPAVALDDPVGPHQKIDADVGEQLCLAAHRRAPPLEPPAHGRLRTGLRITAYAG